MEKLKIFAVGDLHGDKELVRTLAEKVVKEKADLIILAGDLTFFEESVKDLVGPFVQTKRPVLIVPGNHESILTHNFLIEMYSPLAKDIHGKYFVKENVGIFGAGGSTKLGPNTMLSEKEMFKLLKEGFEKIKGLPKKIMVTHEHPEGSKSSRGGIRGSTSIARAISLFKPDLHIAVGGFVEARALRAQ